MTSPRFGSGLAPAALCLAFAFTAFSVGRINADLNMHRSAPYVVAEHGQTVPADSSLRVAIANDEYVSVYVSASNEIRIARPPDPDIHRESVEWSPDGQLLGVRYVAFGASYLDVFSISSGTHWRINVASDQGSSWHVENYGIYAIFEGRRISSDRLLLWSVEGEVSEVMRPSYDRLALLGDREIRWTPESNILASIGPDRALGIRSKGSTLWIDWLNGDDILTRIVDLDPALQGDVEIHSVSQVDLDLGSATVWAIYSPPIFVTASRCASADQLHRLDVDMLSTSPVTETNLAAHMELLWFQETANRALVGAFGSSCGPAVFGETEYTQDLIEWPSSSFDLLPGGGLEVGHTTFRYASDEGAMNLAQKGTHIEFRLNDRLVYGADSSIFNPVAVWSGTPPLAHRIGINQRSNGEPQYPEKCGSMPSLERFESQDSEFELIEISGVSPPELMVISRTAERLTKLDIFASLLTPGGCIWSTVAEIDLRATFFPWKVCIGENVLSVTATLPPDLRSEERVYTYKVVGNVLKLVDLRQTEAAEMLGQCYE